MTIIAGTPQSLARVGTAAAPIGAFVLFVSTLLHPMSADPNDAPAAFAEYAADSFYVWSHMGQFAGFVLIGVALVALAATLEAGLPAACARVGVVGTAACIAVAAALQAVDGVALKAMVNRWETAEGGARGLAFEAALAVRQIEIGLAGYLSLLTGFTLAVLGFAVLQSARYPRWLGLIGVADGFGMMAAGAVQASTGFSALAMMMSMPASFVMLVWLVAAGTRMGRLAPLLGAAAEHRTS
jgi:hypothetical protein